MYISYTMSWPPTGSRVYRVEIVETEEKINGFLPIAAAMLESEAISVEKVRFFSTARLG